MKHFAITATAVCALAIALAAAAANAQISFNPQTYRQMATRTRRQPLRQAPK